MCEKEGRGKIVEAPLKYWDLDHVLDMFSW